MFKELLLDNNIESLQNLQLNAKKIFPQMIEKSYFEFWNIHFGLPNKKNFILLGIATYSIDDLCFLDDIEKQIYKINIKKMYHIYLYDTSIILDVKYFETIYPGIGKIYQTPIIGFWIKGNLEKKVWGYKAKKLLKKELFGNERLEN
jgi:hypothetical protein